VHFEDISLFLESGRRRANAVNAGGQTFQHTFEKVVRVTARWHKLQMRVRGFSVKVKLDFPVREYGCGIQKHYWMMKFPQQI
jgi:hypothetical protein